MSDCKSIVNGVLGLPTRVARILSVHRIYYIVMWFEDYRVKAVPSNESTDNVKSDLDYYANAALSASVSVSDILKNPISIEEII